MTNQQNNLESWEKEFFTNFGANKIWVTPSRDNVETILEVHSFISQVSQESYKRGVEAGESAEHTRMTIRNVVEGDESYEGGKKMGLERAMEIVNNRIKGNSNDILYESLIELLQAEIQTQPEAGSK